MRQIHRLLRAMPRPRFTSASPHVSLLVAASIGVATFASGVRAQDLTLPENKCLAAKIKGLTGSIYKRAACVSKGIKTGTPDDPCLDKSSDKFTGGADPTNGAYNKVEEKYPLSCLTYDDQNNFESAITGLLLSLEDMVGSASGVCNAAKMKCVGQYAAAIGTCNAKGASKDGIPGPICIAKASDKLANGVDGCLDKAATNPDCAFPGAQADQLRGAVDRFLKASAINLIPAPPECSDVVPPSLIPPSSWPPPQLPARYAPVITPPASASYCDYDYCYIYDVASGTWSSTPPGSPNVPAAHTPPPSPASPFFDVDYCDLLYCYKQQCNGYWQAYWRYSSELVETETFSTTKFCDSYYCYTPGGTGF